MGKCFVMQPFDRGAFDKRYDDVLAPAIQDAGLEPYRVDRDPTVSIPINEIESGIRRSEICLAEITSDNPNVWFELGFAIAVPKEVVLVCSDERKTKFPFDVQHRSIIQYKTEAPQDYEILRRDVSQRIKAVLKKQQEIASVSGMSVVAETEGLSQHELVALVTVMQNSFIALDGVSSWKIKEDMNNAGFTDIAVSLALKRLRQKNMLYMTSKSDEQGYEYTAYFVQPEGEQWLLDNQDKLILKAERAAPPRKSKDLPF